MSILDRFRLDGRRLFITGGSRGLGREMALAIADAGADVVLTGRDAASLERTAAEIRALGRQAWPIQADMAEPADCEAACAQALARARPDRHPDQQRRRPPRPDAAPTTCRSRSWQELIDLNLTSTFSAPSSIGGAMVERGAGGRVINIASINALRRRPRHRRAALRDRQGRGRPAHPRRRRRLGAARRHRQRDLPGPVHDRAQPALGARAARDHRGIKRADADGDFGQPEDLGPLAVYLASDASRFMTGAALVIDGGYTLW